MTIKIPCNTKSGHKYSLSQLKINKILNFNLDSVIFI